MSDVALGVLVGAVGVAFAFVVLFIARKGLISTRYALGWLFVAGCLTLGGLFAGVLDAVASWLGVASGSLVAALVAGALLAITVQLSITVSGLLEIVRTLAESIALLEERIRRLETARSEGVEETP